MAAQGLTSFALLQIGLNRHQHADLNTRIGQHEPQVVSAASTPLTLFPNNQGYKSLDFVIETQQRSPKSLKFFYCLSKLSTFATRNRLPFKEGCVVWGQDLQNHLWAPSGANMS